ncbi:MAG TPA: S1 RNA-binding domain-containing protein [Candidatus Krumholzibacteria bacterium]|nr:S1 RNA-binding domain-containing protein [Candidatus Krumholzibacteria bacterium]
MTDHSERPDETPNQKPDTIGEDAAITPADATGPEAGTPDAATPTDEPKREPPEAEPEKDAEETSATPPPAADDAVVMESADTESTPAAAAAAASSPTSPSSDEETTDPAASAEQADAVASDERLTSKYKSGQRMDVKLVQIGEKDSFVDYGGTAEGTIATAELKNPDGEMRVDEGDTFPAIVRKAGETLEFTVGRGKGKGGDLLRMRELQGAHEGDIPVSGKIKSTNKGGFEVDLNGVRAFCPFSQIDTIYCDKPEEHVGNEYTFQIIAFERGGRNIVLSRRKIIEEESKAAAETTRENLAVGEIFEGTVRRLQPYGAFIDLGGVDGLVHVSEISRGHVADPRDVLSVGQKVRVQIIKLDDIGGERERISLSMKVLETDPWDKADEKWAVGSIVSGKVVRLTDFGAFVELSPGVDGLVHVSEISTERVDHPGSVLEPGQSVDVRILSVDPDGRRISLTMRPEGEERAPRAPRDDADRGGRGDRGPRGRRGRDHHDNRPGESYTFGAEEEPKDPDVDVNELDFSDAVELLKQKFNRD